ncbi:hypothetical protein CLF_113030 [Clonorchis sinensis]|uniref:Uncharacterized protein n=1 Tax=Clonorchis sinensis TaxID=79923 RepID=G7YXH6_CLOSI|nr:hypothetical protein CLF_113030 [Clonorchis sinensis]
MTSRGLLVRASLQSEVVRHIPRYMVSDNASCWAVAVTSLRSNRSINKSEIRVQCAHLLIAPGQRDDCSNENHRIKIYTTAVNSQNKGKISLVICDQNMLTECVSFRAGSVHKIRRRQSIDFTIDHLLDAPTTSKTQQILQYDSALVHIFGQSKLALMPDGLRRRFPRKTDSDATMMLSCNGYMIADIQNNGNTEATDKAVVDNEKPREREKAFVTRNAQLIQPACRKKAIVIKAITNHQISLVKKDNSGQASSGDYENGEKVKRIQLSQMDCDTLINNGKKIAVDKKNN